MTHKFNIAGHEGYITVGLYPDGRVGELFITMAKEGSTIGGLMDCFGTAISMSLQYGVPLRVYVEKFSHTKFDPQGHTKNPDIPIAKSLVDYIFRWLGQTFLSEQPIRLPSQNDDLGWDGMERRRGRASVEGKRSSEAEPVLVKNIAVIDSSVASPEPSFREPSLREPSESLESLKAETFTITTTVDLPYTPFQSDAPLCDVCGAITIRSGNCHLCHNCGKSMGCS